MKTSVKRYIEILENLFEESKLRYGYLYEVYDAQSKLNNDCKLMMDLYLDNFKRKISKEEFDGRIQDILLREKELIEKIGHYKKIHDEQRNVFYNMTSALNFAKSRYTSVSNSPSLPKKVKIGNYTKDQFLTLTRLLFNDILPKQCEMCGSKENLHIHHKKYNLPIIKEDLLRVCRSCHLEIHHGKNYRKNNKKK